MRCLTLADALRERGAKCRFVCRMHDGHLGHQITERGHQVHALPKPNRDTPTVGGDLAHASWLGVDWFTDAQETQQFLSKTKLDWLIVDNYSLDHRWESLIRPVSNRIMVIDDLADRRHDCDLLLDQNYGSSTERYTGLVAVECIQLHGPQFALLKPVYAKCRAKQRVSSGKIKRVLIYFGSGADPMNLTGKALCAFQAPVLNRIEVDIVVGSAYAHKKELEATAATRGKTRIHSQLQDLSELMVKADIAIGAGGATTWERCCLGLASIVVSIADNQRPASTALGSDGLIEYLGCVDDITSELIRERVLELLGKPDKLSKLSEKGMQLVDGHGLLKVMEALKR